MKKILCTLFAAGCFWAAKAQLKISDTMRYNRAQIDTLDQQIIDLLGQRTKAARTIGIYKMHHNINVVQDKRFEKVLESAIKRGRDNQLSEKFIRDLYDDIHQESIRQEEAIKLRQ
ncbi:chorismate mutase [Arachidicoccus terrestris]|uniref:chorismate mutase n=1 Tax=Arachidicoccus terrestris TaxID=2875539 RepID=UPI001CC46608|nr:chorismate mutase [Arachidicoccus terrestris]UAY55847.1 chorismate mutase [Arachidicoccus terrestris]